MGNSVEVTVEELEKKKLGFLRDAHYALTPEDYAWYQHKAKEVQKQIDTINQKKKEQ